VNVRPDPQSPWGFRIWIPDAGFDTEMDAVRGLVAGELFEYGSGIDVDKLLMCAPTTSAQTSQMTSQATARIF